MVEGICLEVISVGCYSLIILGSSSVEPEPPQAINMSEVAKTSMFLNMMYPFY